MKQQRERRTCAAPLDFATLIDYWLGELDDPASGRVDEHLLGCGSCVARLQGLVDLGAGVRTLVRQGAVQAVVTDALLDTLRAHGLQLREYRVAHNGSVHCTVAPDDDVMVARLQVPLGGVVRVDALLLDFEGVTDERLQDIPFDAAAGEVVFTPRIGPIRASGAATGRIRLLAVDPQGERTLGEYTFVHTPWPGA